MASEDGLHTDSVVMPAKSIEFVNVWQVTLCTYGLVFNDDLSHSKIVGSVFDGYWRTCGK